jgi:hypothetical protein
LIKVHFVIYKEFMLIKLCADLIIQALKFVQQLTEQVATNFLKVGIWLRTIKKLCQIKKLNHQIKMDLTVTQMMESIAMLTISLNVILKVVITAQQAINLS